MSDYHDHAQRISGMIVAIYQTIVSLKASLREYKRKLFANIWIRTNNEEDCQDEWKKMITESDL